MLYLKSAILIISNTLLLIVNVFKTRKRVWKMHELLPEVLSMKKYYVKVFVIIY